MLLNVVIYQIVYHNGYKDTIFVKKDDTFKREDAVTNHEKKLPTVLQLLLLHYLRLQLISYKHL